MRNNKLVFIILAIVLGISLVACSSEEATKDGHITLQYIYYETENGALFFEEESLGIDYFELNGNKFRRPPYSLYNLPGNEFYSYTIKAYDAEGVLMASGSGQWMVVEGFTTTQTATLTVRHQHTFRDTWSSDESYHWHASSCGHAAVGSKEQHTFDGDVCTVCGYDKHVHTYSSSWSSNNYSHWHAATCGHDVRGNEAQHTFGSDTVVSAPTCTKAGTGSHTCTVCGKTVTYTIPATGHTSNGGTVTTEATCQSKGIKTHTCTICGETYTEDIPRLSHIDNGSGVCSLCHVVLEPYIGPSGGYVFYDKGEYSDGWRYLEAAPADLRIVGGIPTIDSNASGYSGATTGYVFGCYRTANNGSNLYVNGTTTYNAADCTGTAIGTGKTNTQLLVNAMGSETYSLRSGSSKTANYVARLCDILTHTVNGVTYNDWFLPSKDELNLMYVFLHKAGLGGFANDNYWSSSEYYNNSDYAWGQYFGSGSQSSYYRGNEYRVRPVRAF